MQALAVRGDPGSGLPAPAVLLHVTRARRINYEILGNLEPALHAHLFPRYGSAPAERRNGPVWLYDWAQLQPFDRAVHGALFDALARGLAMRNVAVSPESEPDPPNRGGGCA